MQAILREDVDGLGQAGSVVNVARGYLRNYLLPVASPSTRPPAASPRSSASSTRSGRPR